MTLPCCYMTYVLYHALLQMPHSMIADAHRQSVDVIAWHPAGHMVGTASHDCILKFWCREPPGSKCDFMCAMRLRRVWFCWCVLVCLCVFATVEALMVIMCIRCGYCFKDAEFLVHTGHTTFSTLVYVFVIALPLFHRQVGDTSQRRRTRVPSGVPAGPHRARHPLGDTVQVHSGCRAGWRHGRRPAPSGRDAGPPQRGWGLWTPWWGAVALTRPGWGLWGP
jgi:hypothetical protein